MTKPLLSIDREQRQAPAQPRLEAAGSAQKPACCPQRSFAMTKSSEAARVLYQRLDPIVRAQGLTWDDVDVDALVREVVGTRVEKARRPRGADAIEDRVHDAVSRLLRTQLNELAVKLEALATDANVADTRPEHVRKADADRAAVQRMTFGDALRHLMRPNSTAVQGRRPGADPAFEARLALYRSWQSR